MTAHESKDCAREPRDLHEVLILTCSDAGVFQHNPSRITNGKMRDQCIFPGVPTSVRLHHLPAEIGPEWNYQSRSVQFAVQYRQISASVVSSPTSTHFRSQCNHIDEISSSQPRLCSFFMLIFSKLTRTWALQVGADRARACVCARVAPRARARLSQADIGIG